MMLSAQEGRRWGVSRRSWLTRPVVRAAGTPRKARRAGGARALVTVMLVVAAAAACGTTHAGPHSSRSASAGSYLAFCGSARTAAEVPVRVEVARGHVPCPTAKAVELAYAKAIRSGRAPGNGGGGPVKIMGWTCQGFATPVVLHTGKASKCTHDSNEILEILPPPSPSAS
jgi:hypothetical protein